jgi:transposase
MRPRGTQGELEARRRRAMAELKKGLGVTEVARRIGCSHSAVIAWRDAVRSKGDKALAARPVPGRPAKLTARQRAKLPRLLLRGAESWGYSTALWTTKRVASVIEREFKVTLHPSNVGRVLRTLGWSCQKPERRALQRDEAGIEHWKRYRWREVKKNGAPQGTPGVPGRKRIPARPYSPAHLGPAGRDPGGSPLL